MNSKLTIVLAGLLIVAALVAGYWGIKLSASDPVPALDTVEQSEAVQQALQRLEQVAHFENENTVPVVVLARTLKPYTALTESDLAIERLSIAPPGSFRSAQELLDKYKTVWREVPKGSILTAAHFEMGGPLSRMIRPHERAIALDVDPTVAGGGHLMPGDYVDVLLYLRQDEKNIDQTAQVVIPAVRLLTIGDTFGVTTQGEPAVVEEELSEEEAQRQSARRQETVRNVVLAIPASLVNRFLLATQVQGGKVRLAARSADEKLLAKYLSATEVETNKTDEELKEEQEKELAELKQQLFQFEQLALSKANKNTRTATRRGAAPLTAPTIEIMRGAQVTRQTL